MNDLICLTVVGNAHAARVAIRWGLADKFPFDHIHPKIVVYEGAISVFLGESPKLALAKADSI